MKSTAWLLTAFLVLPAIPTLASGQGTSSTGGTKQTVKKATPSPTAVPSSNAQAASSTAQEGSPNDKHVWIAKSLSVVPGLVIHGSGNMYAGSWMTGLGLFVVGTGGAALAGVEGYQGYNSIKGLGQNNNGAIPDDLSGAYGRLGLIVVGTAAFIWSEWVDVAGCGMAVDRYNKKVDEEARGHAEIIPTNGGAVMAYTRSF